MGIQASQAEAIPERGSDRQPCVVSPTPDSILAPSLYFFVILVNYSLYYIIIYKLVILGN